MAFVEIVMHHIVHVVASAKRKIAKSNTARTVAFVRFLMFHNVLIATTQNVLNVMSIVSFGRPDLMLVVDALRLLFQKLPKYTNLSWQNT